MKLQLSIAASVLALMAGSAQAQTVLSGYAGVGVDYTSATGKYDSESVSDRTNGYFFDSAASLPVVGIFGAQVDLAYHNYSDKLIEGGYREGDHSDGLIATGHVFARTDQWLLGVFVGADDAGVFNVKGGGVEGQYYLGKLTLAGSIGAATESEDQGDSYKPYVVSGRVDARYFVTDDLMIGAHAGYEGSDYHNNSGVYYEELKAPGLWTVGVGAEYRIAASPFTVTANYEHGDSKITDDYGETGFYQDNNQIRAHGDYVSIGARWTFGGSLLNRDRHGASLSTMKDMFGGAFGDSVATYADDY